MSQATARSTRFGFSKLLVADLDRQADFYTKVFGLKILRRIEAELEGEHLSEIVLDTGKADKSEIFILFTYPSRPAPPIGEVVLGFFATDLAATVQRAVEHGATVQIAPMTLDGNRFAFVTDPEGHVCEIIERA
jgi:predicted enzyme related to lactoylglutathione lyase